MTDAAPCSHLDAIQDVAPTAGGCVDCLATGSWWVHLRLCRTCGYVGCCDQSPNRHASKHFEGIGHPLIASLEPEEDWTWCFVDEVYLIPDD
jgi:hypothetical protein